MGRHLLGLMRKMRVGDKFQAGVKSVCVGGGYVFQNWQAKENIKR